LNCQGTINRISSTGKNAKASITIIVYYLPIKMSYPFFKNRIVMPDNRHRLLFVLLHHGRVPDYVGEHNSGELAGLRHESLFKLNLSNKNLLGKVLWHNKGFAIYTDPGLPHQAIRLTCHSSKAPVFKDIYAPLDEF
jgi:hypothetical protein